MATTTEPNLLTRDDTFFGVCEGLGRDTGIHPNILRITLALGLFLSPVGAVAAYAGGGILVAFTRWLHPEPRRAVVAENAAPEPLAPEYQAELPLAA